MTKAPRSSGATPSGSSPASTMGRAPGHTSATASLPARAGGTNAPAGDGPDPTAGLLEPFTLPSPLRERFEDSLGVDLGGVRLHTGDESAAEASAMGAHAFATGSNIHFAAGQYNPDDPFGQHLIAHEVAHTVQQSSGAASGAQLVSVASPSTDSLEEEADRAADAMIGGQRASLGSRGHSGVMRKSADNPPGTGSKAHAPSITVNGGPDAAAPSAPDWKACGGDALISTVRAALATWRTHRDQPKSNKFAGRASIVKAAREFQDRVPQAQWAAMRAQANRELGSSDLAALEELLSMEHQGFSVSEVFNVKIRDVKHIYRLTFEESTVLSKGVLSYENDLPAKWSWKHDITVGSIGVKANVYPPSFKPTFPRFVGTFDKATATGYYGWEDFAGMTSAIKGSSAKGKMGGIGVDINTGMSLSFTKIGVTFDNFKVKTKVDGAGSGKEVEITGVELGAGPAMVGDAPGDVDSAPLATLPGLADVRYEQRATLNMFALASAEITSPMFTALEELRNSLMTFRHERIEPHAGTLKKMGIDPMSLMKLDAEITGWASRRWEGAPDDAERRKRNEKLSLERATNAAQACQVALGSWSLAVTTHGRGSRMYSEAAGAYVGEAELYARLATIEQRLADLKKQLTSADPAQRPALLGEQKKLVADKAVVEADFDKKKNALESPQDQCVNIVVRWSGKLPDEGAPATPKPAKGTP